jgi:7-cyano-7-deazaguanine synthase in queuosine biosynthesis
VEEICPESVEVACGRPVTYCLAGVEPGPADVRLQLGGNLLTGAAGLSAVAVGRLSSLEEDTLNVLAAIYGSDLAVKRGYGEGFVRDIRLGVEVSNRQAFEAIRADLQYALWVLSSDNWTVEFIARAGAGEATHEWPRGLGRTLLFSGGLDSYAAATEYVSQGEPLRLVSHVTQNRVIGETQEALYGRLQGLAKTPLERTAIRVSGRTRKGWPFPQDQEREDTQRTRSLLFLGLASLVARRTGFDEIVAIAENGQMAINLPLTAARVGPFSTHTAHPEFLALAEGLFSALLNHRFTIRNPYVYLTKSEVIDRIPDGECRAGIVETVSCWRASRVGPSRHCGDCVPCLVRRFALESRGIAQAEYARDLLREDIGRLDQFDPGKRNLVEMIEFSKRILRKAPLGSQAVVEEFPDIAGVGIQIEEAVGVYARFATETMNVLAQYPGVAGIL